MAFINYENTNTLVFWIKSKSSLRYISVLFVLSSIITLPFIFVDVPPILDYPNHLARIYILSLDIPKSAFAGIYAPNWKMIPDLAMDVIVLGMLKVTTLYTAGKVALALALLLPVIGTVAYSRSQFGRFDLWSYGSFVVAYNALFILGFVNQLISFGLALLTLAAYLALVKQNWLLAHLVAALLAVLVFFSHVLGLAVLLVMLSLHKLERVLGFWPLFRQMAGRALAEGAGLAAIALGPLLLYVLSDFSQKGGVVVWTSAEDKLRWVLSPLLSYSALASFFALGCIALSLMLIARYGRFRLSLPTCAAFAAIFLAFPYLVMGMKGASHIDIRLLCFAGFLFFCAFVPENLPRRWALTIAGLLLAATVTRTVEVGTAWWEQRQDLADLRWTIAPVPPRGKVLVAIAPGPGHFSYWAGDPSLLPPHPISRYMAFAGMPTYAHMPALLVMERNAFWPLLFVSAEQHPLRVTDEYRDLSNPSGLPPSMLLLGLDDMPYYDLDKFPYLENWPAHFDYLLVLNSGIFGDMSHFLPDNLQFLRQTSIGALYRVKRTSSLIRSTEGAK